MKRIRRPPRGGRGLKFSVDFSGFYGLGRPPRGGRGLKFVFGVLGRHCALVALLAEGVD